jgi:hypothetical protein
MQTRCLSEVFTQAPQIDDEGRSRLEADDREPSRPSKDQDTPFDWTQAGLSKALIRASLRQ